MEYKIHDLEVEVEQEEIEAVKARKEQTIAPEVNEPLFKPRENNFYRKIVRAQFIIAIFCLLTFGSFTVFNIQNKFFNTSMWGKVEYDESHLGIVQNFVTNAYTDIDQACKNAYEPYFVKTGSSQSVLKCNEIKESKDSYTAHNRFYKYGIDLLGSAVADGLYMEFKTGQKHFYYRIRVITRYSSDKELPNQSITNTDFYVTEVNGELKFSFMQPSEWPAFSNKVK